MKHEIKIIKQTRQDGSVYYLPYLLIYKYCLFGFYLYKQKHGIIKTRGVEKYAILDSFFNSTHSFNDYEWAKSVANRTVEEYFKHISHSKVIKEELL